MTNETIFTDKKTDFLTRYVGNYSTPKKLNRSSKKIPAEIVDKIESGEITSADLVMLSTEFPIFKYKTCITIHGSFPDISIQHIGGYKNIIQNANGSLEIRYNAIDYKKKSQLYGMIKSHGWSWVRTSSQDHFCHTIVTRDKEDAIKQLKEQKQKWEGKQVSNMSCKIVVQGWSYFGRFYIETILVPYDIATDEVSTIAASICDVAPDILIAEYNELQKQQEEQKKQWEARMKQQQEKADQDNAEIAQKEAELMQTYKQTEIGVGTYIHVAKTTRGIGYCQVQTEKASFGRLKVKTRYSLDKNSFTGEFKEARKLMKPSEITNKKVFLCQ